MPGLLYPEAKASASRGTRINRIALAIPARNPIFVKKGGSLQGWIRSGLDSRGEPVGRLGARGEADAIVFEAANYVSRIAY